MLQAVIFDLDGVLVDSYQAHFESWAAPCAEHDVPLGEQRFASTFGTTREIVHMLWPQPPDERTVQAIDDRKEALFREIVARDFPAMDGAGELLQSLRNAGVELAVGSSGPPENVQLAVDNLGSHFFTATVTGGDVERGKPDPQVFLLAAERLGVAPTNCVVIEDAAVGIEAAHAAGMAAVTLTSTGHLETDFSDQAPALIVRSLRELSPDVLRQICRRALAPCLNKPRPLGPTEAS